jgi:ADP-ribose pyrophosphatase YjhB (NUDIX family)
MNDTSFLPAGQFGKKIPDGDDRERLVCTDCGFINYQNPVIVVGSVPLWQDKILLCKRAIEPRKGHWTLPAGFMEEGETVEEGVLREAYEEATVKLELNGMLAIYSVPRISQVHIFFRSNLVDGKFKAGIESADVQLFSWEDIPWDDLAFPTVFWALNHAREVWHKDSFVPFSNPKNEDFMAVPQD